MPNNSNDDNIYFDSTDDRISVIAAPYSAAHILIQFQTANLVEYDIYIPFICVQCTKRKKNNPKTYDNNNATKYDYVRFCTLCLIFCGMVLFFHKLPTVRQRFLSIQPLPSETTRNWLKQNMNSLFARRMDDTLVYMCFRFFFFAFVISLYKSPFFPHLFGTIQTNDPSRIFFCCSHTLLYATRSQRRYYENCDFVFHLNILFAILTMRLSSEIVMSLCLMSLFWHIFFFLCFFIHARASADARYRFCCSVIVYIL